MPDDKRPQATAGRAADNAAGGSLGELRARVDQLDRQIVELLNQRAQLSIKIGSAKGAAATYVPEREAEIYDALVRQSQGPLPPDALKAIYSEIISSSRVLQTPLKVAFLGPEATFTHQAALVHFGTSTKLVPVPTIPDIFGETEAGRCDLGIIPIENSSEGAVTFALDSFVDSELKACAEVRLEIHEALMSKSGIDAIKTVYSHPQAIAQCRGWLRQHLPGVSLVETASTVGAAERASLEDGAAAIGPVVAAKLYALNVLESRIEDVGSNTTRFLVIGPRMGERTGRDRMALLFSIKDRVGVLLDVLAVFARAGINLSKIESRPSKRRAWDYLFFVDLDAHPSDTGVPEALRELEELTVFVKVLGAWRRPV